MNEREDRIDTKRVGGKGRSDHDGLVNPRRLPRFRYTRPTTKTLDLTPVEGSDGED